MSVEAQVRDVAAISDAQDNGELMSYAGRLGYIEGDTLDLTYGEGAFWSDGAGEYCERLVCNDLYKPTMCSADFRATFWDSASFDTVVFDPPYKLAGTPASPDMDSAYGTETTRTRYEVHALIVGGLAECSRLTRKWVLVKCQDQVSSGQVRWQTDLVSDVMRVLELRKVDSLMLPGGRPQPKGTRQVHARRNYSTLLVFKRGR